MKKNKPGQGRKPIDPALRKKRFTAWTRQDFMRRFRDWCVINRVSQGDGIEYCCKKATDDFTKDIEEEP